jgi:hypothetical protein
MCDRHETSQTQVTRFVSLHWIPSYVKYDKLLCPSGEGDGLELHWPLAAGARIHSVSI